MSSPPPTTTKKRPLDTPADRSSSKTLHKPFRSPLKVKNEAINRAVSTPDRTPSYLKSSFTSHKAHDENTHPRPYLPSTAAHTAFRPHLLASDSQVQTPARASLTRATTATPALTPTLSSTTQQPHPTLQLSTLRTQVDTLTQSLHILSASRRRADQSTTPPTDPDADLLHLITKYRTVARTAAEELYGTARDKVNRMGGVGGWRAKEEARAEQRKGWDVEAREEEARRVEREVEGDDDSDDDDDEEGEGDGGRGGGGSAAEGREKLSKSERRVLREEAREARRQAKEAREEEVSEYDKGWAAEAEAERKNEGAWGEAGGDDAFTMGMMLRSMGVDLGVVGWDGEKGRWVD